MVASIHDVSIAGGIDPSMIERSIRRMINREGFDPGSPTEGQGRRWDSEGGRVARRHSAEVYRRRTDAACIRSYLDSGQRIHPDFYDAWDSYLERLKPEDREAQLRRADAAGGGPRTFEFLYSEVWDEVRAPLSGERAFPNDTRVPLGAKYHTARRLTGRGEARIHRAGESAPLVRTGRAEERLGVAYIVSAIQTSWVDVLSEGFAGIQQQQEDLAVAKRAVKERRNEIIWNGHEASNLRGVLNYPHLATRTFPIVVSRASDPNQIVQILNTVASTARIESGGAMDHTAMITSERLETFFRTRKHEINGGTDSTIKKFFLDNQRTDGIKDIMAADELRGIGPNGEDGILFYRPEVSTIAHIDIQSEGIMPAFQASPFDHITVVWAATGGMRSIYIGNMILVLVPVEGIG